jgi:TRAP-type C4-dicarboxylate transport system permease small subunit
MKKCRLILAVFIMLMIFTTEASAQCSICTKTAQQMGERPAKALNKGIMYLAFTPLLIMGYVGYRWWNSNREV